MRNVQPKTPLQNSEILKIIYDLSQNTVFILENGMVIECSPYAEKLTGFSRDELIGMDALTLVPDSEQKKVSDYMLQDRTSYKTTILNCEGAAIPVKINARNVMFSDQMIRIVNIYDMRIEHKLELSEELYRTIFEYMGNAIFLFDNKRNILRANKEFAKMVGIEPAKLIGRKWSDFIHPDHRELMLRYNKLRMKGSRIPPESYEFKLVDSAGEAYECRIYVRIIENQDMGIASVVDISETKKLEYELFSLNDALEERVEQEIQRRIKSEKQKNKLQKKQLEQEHLLTQQAKLASMGEMIGNIAHQWRQPLNTLGLMLFNLYSDFMDKTLSEEKMDGVYKDMRFQIDKMSQTIDDFRHFFKPVKSKKIFSLKDVINDSIKMVEAQLTNSYIDLKTKIEEDIPVYGYESELSQVIINIINNAKDEILRKKIDGKIKIRAFSEKKDLCVIEIEDNAGGVPKQYLEKLFEPYFTTKSEGQGSGIGLYMCKMIIEKNMGGQLYVVNEKKGAKFVIRLPVAKESKKE